MSFTPPTRKLAMSIIFRNSFRRTTRKIWVVYRVTVTKPAAKEDARPTGSARRRERVYTSRTPDGARRAARRDRRRQEAGNESSGELSWELWGDRLVSRRSGSVVYSIELYDVLRN